MKTKNTISRRDVSEKHLYENQKKNLLGFTLTELIVTISILAILGAISIISIQNFYGSARDSVRVSDIQSIHQWLSLYKTKADVFPIPESPIEIQAGTETLSYQGYIWENLSRVININKTPTDPIDLTRYIYTVDKAKKKAQLMGYLESGDTIKTTAYSDMFSRLINQSYATTNTIDYESRVVYVYGNKIGVLTDENNAPIQESTTGTGIDLNTTDTTGYVAYFWWDTYGAGESTGTGDILITQIQWAITDTIPCNPLSYSGYTITALAHNETKTFTKPLTIANGTATGSLQVACINGTVDTDHAIEITNVSCNATFVNTGDNTCVPDVCGGTIPIDAEMLTWTTQSIAQSWVHSDTAGVCTFECSMGYTWNGTNACADITPPTIMSIIPSAPACNTVRFTINGANDTVALHSTPYSFDGWSTWQAGNTKDYATTSQTIIADQIQVRDTTGNIYSHTSSANGTSNSCAVNGACDTATTFACLDGTISVSNVAGSCGANATWSCNGLNGGTNASCSKANPVCPTLPTFTALSNQSCNTTVASNSTQINSIPASTTISVSGGKYAISSDNSTWGTWTNGAGTINLGNYVKLQAVEPANGNTSTTVTLTVWGGATRSWVATTGAPGAWVPTATQTWQSSGYWGQYWQPSGYWIAGSTVWVSSGYWLTTGWWCLSGPVYSGPGDVCWPVEVWVDTSGWVTQPDVWVDTSGWVSYWVDTSGWVTTYPNVWTSPYGCN